MVALVTCMNEDDPIKIEDARVVTTLFIIFFRCLRVANSILGDGICLKGKHIQAFMVGLVLARMKKILLKNKGARVITTFLPL